MDTVLLACSSPSEIDESTSEFPLLHATPPTIAPATTAAAHALVAAIWYPSGGTRG
ncbi:MAG: hypothetical protein QM765_18580 [Myxococcales bacterium]